ncbi:MAG: hypothetical protein ACR2I7_07195 [Geodermatophilaceae bacterium]
MARAVHILDPAGIEDRHTADLTRRRVTLTPVENGMSQLWALPPADGADHPAPPRRGIPHPRRPGQRRPTHR